MGTQINISSEDSAKASSAATAVIPKDAAAVILLRGGVDAANPQVFWVRRSQKMVFLGGFHAFPGGQRDAGDAETRVENCEDAEAAAMISCAARELFEETGVLIARGRAHTLTKGQRASLLDELESGRMSFSKTLAHFDLYLDARDWTFVGRWVTPPFSPRRFDTWFFLVRCPIKQEPIVRTTENDAGEWTSARDAYHRWQRSEVLAAPPVIHALKTLAGGITVDLVERFLSVPHAHAEPVRRIEFRPGFICYPLRTPTKPPATHTNCYIIGTRELLIIDPASPYEDEQQALARCVDDLQAEGRRVREIILTHLHPDHTGGVAALSAHLGERVPVAAHRLTMEALRGSIRVDRMIEDEEMIELPGSPSLRLRAMHTPGHARGHLCFYEEHTGALVTGDNIVGLGSVLIDPPEGNMRDYFQSLEKMRALPRLSVLFGAHGPAMGNPREKIDEYIAHRREREANILAAVRAGGGGGGGALTPKEIVARVYTDVSPKAHDMAERAVVAHLEKLEADNFVTRGSDGGYHAVNDTGKRWQL